MMEFHIKLNILIFCEISSKEETKFIKAMERLKANMILLGHDDYYDVIKEFMELFNRHRL